MKYRSVSDPSHFDTKTSIVDENNRIVAQVVDERQAALIAAAPDLLDAMKAVESWMDDLNTENPFTENLLQNVRAAIAKAEGRDKR